MKSADQFEDKKTAPSQGTKASAAPSAAIAYYRAAERDEKNGYSLTAAMEWHKAAELVASVPGAADFCWKQWERIMHLPRHLAQPIPGPSSGELAPAAR